MFGAGTAKQFRVNEETFFDIIGRLDQTQAQLSETQAQLSEAQAQLRDAQAQLQELQESAQESLEELSAGTAVTWSDVWNDKESCRNPFLDSDDAWCSLYGQATGDQYLQFDLLRNYLVYGVVIQARGGAGSVQHVDKFKVEVGTDSDTLQPVDSGKEFDGIRFYSGNPQPTSRTRMYVLFDKPVKAKYVKFIPTAVTAHISMRAGVLVATKTFNSPVPGVDKASTRRLAIREVNPAGNTDFVSYG